MISVVFLLDQFYLQGKAEENSLFPLGESKLLTGGIYISVIRLVV